MAKRNTKEIILDESLALFAQQGYDGVTMRDIAARVGIMQSSLYKHYASKQAIFDTLVDTMQQRFDSVSATLRLPAGSAYDMAQSYADVDGDFLTKTSASLFLFYLRDPYASQFRKMLLIEKYKNARADRIYRAVYFDQPLAYQSALFAHMIKQGHMRAADPDIVALHFFAPVLALLNKYDGLPDQEDEALRVLQAHMQQFDQMYRIYPTET